MPAHKKHPSARKRRNRASTAATLSLAPPPADDEEYVEWDTLTVKQLRLECEHRDLASTGRKAELVARLEEDDDTTDIPDLPDRPLGWHSEVVKWWNAVWSSPMEQEWHVDTDYYNLVAAAMHLDDMWMAEDAGSRQKADTAFVKRIATLGLTPYDRRRLEWTIASAGEATDRRNRRRGATPIGDAPSQPPRSDPRAHLVGATS